jgi:aryl-alcohol dehydrogenase-like predicted oxidoreductase
MKRLHNAEVLAERDKCSVTQVAMRYVFSHPMNTFAIASTTNPDRLPQNIQAALTPFNAEDVKFLENDT